MEIEMTTMSLSVSEMAARLTGQVNQTLEYLYNDGYLTVEQYDDLSARLVVCPVRNKPKWFSARILNRFFGEKDSENSWSFPITSIQPARRNEVTEEGNANESDQ